jgi:hypothetical protein
MDPHTSHTLVYYESRKREIKRRLINEGRCDERPKAKVEESTLGSKGGNFFSGKVFFFNFRTLSPTYVLH